LVMGPTMDRQIVRSLFGEVIAASEILGVDAELRKRLIDMRGRILPNEVGQYGQLKEPAWACGPSKWMKIGFNSSIVVAG
jgi:alpha-L-fucosidase 2